MNDSVTVRFIERVRNLKGVFERLLQRKRTLRQPIRERLALEVLHHDVVDVILAADLSAVALAKVDVVEGADVRMIQARNGARLLLEALAELGMLRKMLGEHFDGDDTIEAGVVGFINLARYSQIVFETQRHKKYFSTGVRKVQLPVEKWERRTMASF